MSEQETNNKNKRLFYEYYKTKRTREFLDQYDHEKAWDRLVSGKNRNRKKRFIFYSVAASILLILSISLLKNQITPIQDFSKKTATNSSQKVRKETVILTLSDGTTIDLETQANNKAVENGALKLNSGVNDQLTYQKTRNTDTSSINQLHIPRGKEYRLTLSDGTLICINAETTIRYPVQFGSVREVELEGEAYFEVAHDKKRPFRVKSKKGVIEVLGTHFNVSAYPASAYETTLAEGKVAVTTEGRTIMLNPNQQAILTTSGELKVNEVDASLYTSWIEGIYKFSDKPLLEITALLTRWYDIEFIYESPQVQYRRFNGTIDKKEDLSFVLSLIADISGIEFQINGRYVTIK